MSDVLDIQSQCCSEFEDETENINMKGVKNRRGRGFNDRSGGALNKIKGFEKVSGSSKPSTYGDLAQSSVEGWVLFVTGIHVEGNEDDVRDIFAEYGTISNLVLNLDRRTGYTKGYALIEFCNYHEASNAKEYLNDSKLLGQTINVNWAFIKIPNFKYLK